MKKRSIFSLLGLLAFVAMPIYAQEEDIPAWEEYIPTLDESYEYDDDYEDYEYSYDYDYDDYAYSNDWANPSYSYSYDGGSMSVWSMALLWGLWLWMMIFSYLAFIFGGLVLLAQWEVYRKAGKKLWAFLIPFWGTMVYSEIAGMKKWSWILPWLLVIVEWCWTFAMMSWSSAARRVMGIIVVVLSIATLVWWIMANYRVARRFWWGKFASILHILFFPITVIIIWLWNYQYQWVVKKESETIVEA